MTQTRLRLLVAALLFGFSWILFLIYIQFPQKENFDEFHYVPSAKQFLQLQVHQNWEHPPLGKELIAVGIGIFGDRPIGWRFMSTLFGALTLVGMYQLALIFFCSLEMALWVALLTLCNHLLYVQARIGMLDTFMFAFIIWGMVGFCSTWNTHLSVLQIRRRFFFCGLMMGFGMACKWFTIVPWLGSLFLVFVIRTFQFWKLSFDHPFKDDWYRPQLWTGISTSELCVFLGILPLATYTLPFLPYCWMSAPSGIHTGLDFFRMQFDMWSNQLRVIQSHPYMSQWWDWAILKRPIWYAFDREPSHPEFVRGVLLLGNPWIMFTGLISLLFCLQSIFRSKNWAAFLIVYFYCAFYCCWWVIPRKISFYYYYYPAGMMLSFALAYVFSNTKKSIFLTWERWIYFGVAVCFFIHFFPILSGMKIPTDDFRHWMWMSSWI